MDPKWVEKLQKREDLARTLNGSATPRDVYGCLGNVVWQSYIMNCPMCFLPATLSFIRRLASATLKEVGSWDIPGPVPPSVSSELKERLHLIEENEWESSVLRTTRTVWSDASSTAWGAIAEAEPKEVAACDAFEGADAERHIYLKELYAALQALRLAKQCGWKNVQIKMMNDNLPVVHSVRKGHSANYMGNILLQHMFVIAKDQNYSLCPQWVPTNEQRADGLTRGKSIGSQMRATIVSTPRMASLRSHPRP
ncbi:hypothetical protein DIPPA_63845 [Diplonema papillatum]|nr:hypothetical protein DIPPA_63845 [Diplonema papillatum]